MFLDEEHAHFYHICLAKLPERYRDSYHKALFYTLGLTRETRNNIIAIYDFKNRIIRPRELTAGWQTGESIRVTCLAFNLFNGYIQKVNPERFTPYGLFESGLQPYMLEAVRIRYPCAGAPRPFVM